MVCHQGRENHRNPYLLRPPAAGKLIRGKNMKIDLYDYSGVKRLLEEYKVKDIMTTPVQIVTESQTLSDVEKIFLSKRVNHVCVVDNDFRLRGLISQKYLYKTIAPRRILPGSRIDEDAQTIIDGTSFYDKRSLDGFFLTDIMQIFPTTLREDDAILKAVEFMVKKDI